MPARLPTLASDEHSFIHGPSCLAGTSHASTFTKLARCAPPPSDRAGWMSACRGAIACLQAASVLVGKLSEPAQEILAEFSSLVRHLDNLAPSQLAESTLPMWRRLAQYPQWTALANATHRPDPGQLAALGIELFSSLHRESVMAAESTRALSRVEPGTLFVSQLQEILMTSRPELTDAPIWAKRLNRLWPDLSQWLDAAPGTATAPTESNADRFRKTLVAKFVYASPKHRGGILDHRHIDLPQLIEIGKQLGQSVRDADGRGAAAMLTWLSAMPTDAIACIPLATHRPEDWVMCIDLEQGLFCTDIQCVSKDLAMPIAGVGHIAASTQVNKPLPQMLQRFLLNRMIATSEANCVGQLLPELTKIKPHEPVIATTREIVPSMARWTQTTGVLMRQLGMDNLLAAVVSNDFAMAPKSKLYYTSISAKEIWTASAELFTKLQWGPPAEMPPSLLAVGSPLVPTEPQLRRTFEEIRRWVEDARPAKRCTLETLFEFHNRYCASVAWIVGFACASRRVSELEWTKHMLTSSVGLLVIEDKQVSDIEGGLPVPLGAVLRGQVDLYVRHLQALHRRLACHEQSRQGDTLKWIAAVLAGEEVPLFKKTCGWHKTLSVGSASVLAELPKDCQVAPDSGRKYWETRRRSQAATAPGRVSKAALVRYTADSRASL